jgi:hypothetical protein
MINDNNTIEDIQGAIYCLQSDIHEDDPEFPVIAQFATLIERIEDKLARNRSPIRKNWFTEALNHARTAQQHFSDLDPDAAGESLRKCLDGITDGNKAHRRKTTFIVAPDGTTTEAQ